MKIRYPNGKVFKPTKNESKLKNHQYGNRGMTLEEDLNESNEYYLANKIAVIHKKPTPIQIVKVDYPQRSKAVIKEAYFKTPSTTDYNGVYKGKYIDFEAKETKSKTSIPLQNFHDHQIEHIRQVIACNGISFVIIRFSTTEEVFLLEGRFLLQFWERMENGGRKSIAKDELVQYGHQIPLGIHPRIDYLKVIDQIYD